MHSTSVPVPARTKQKTIKGVEVSVEAPLFADDDLLTGVGPITRFMYNDDRKRQRVARMIKGDVIPTFNIGPFIYSRKSWLRAWFADQEAAAQGSIRTLDALVAALRDGRRLIKTSSPDGAVFEIEGKGRLCDPDVAVQAIEAGMLRVADPGLFDDDVTRALSWILHPHQPRA